MKCHSVDSRSIRREGDDVTRDRWSDGASCAAILHDAGNRGSQHGRARQDGGGRDRHPIASAAPRSMDHLRQRPCGAVLSHCRAALHDPCRRRGKGRVRGAPISLARAGRDRVRDRPPNVRRGFDPAFTSVAKIDYALGIPLTHLEIADPVLPIYVNAYLPPQPSMERCWAFGQTLARIVSAMGVSTVVLASGGMSHYPGTERYAAPDLAWDRAALARIAAGNLKSLVGYDAAELDAAGNVELRC